MSEDDALGECVGCWALSMRASHRRTTYQKPPAAIEQLLDAPATPLVRVSPDRTMLLIEQPPRFRRIADVAQPRYRLAGLRFNPSDQRAQRREFLGGAEPAVIAGGAAKPVRAAGEAEGDRTRAGRRTGSTWRSCSEPTADLPLKHRAARAWSSGSSTWRTAQAHRVSVDAAECDARRAPCEWMPDSASLLCKVIPSSSRCGTDDQRDSHGPEHLRRTSVRRPPRPPTRTC